MLKVPSQSLKAYQEAPVWKNFWNIEGYKYAGVDEAVADGFKVEVENGSIKVSGLEDGAEADVYTLDGVLAGTTVSGYLQGVMPGIYLVSARSNTLRVIVR